MFTFTIITAQRWLIEEDSFMEKIDKKQKNEGIDAAIKYIKDNELGFIHNGRMYVASYSNTKRYVSGSNRDFNRRAFLFERKVNIRGKWNKANPNPLFDDSRKKSATTSIKEMQKVKKVETKNGTCYMMFIKKEDYYHGHSDFFTHFFFFHPPVNSVSDFEIYEWTDGRKLFVYEKRKGNIFYDASKDFKFKVEFKWCDRNESLIPSSKTIY